MDDFGAKFPAELSPGALWKMLLQNQQQMITFQQAQISFQEETNKKLTVIADIMSQAKGGWKVFIFVGTITGGAIGWAMHSLLKLY